MNAQFMESALKSAENAFSEDCVPVGAVIVKDEKLIYAAGNGRDAIAHAELKAIAGAIRILNSNFLNDCSIYVTLEPCAMCAQAISLARIKNLYFGAYDLKYGSVIHNARIFQYAMHKPNIVGGILELKCSQILQSFFENKRNKL